MMNNFKLWLSKVNQTLFDLFLPITKVGVFFQQNIHRNIVIKPLLSYERIQSSRFPNNITSLVILLCSMLSSFYLKAQNAPLGCDKYYMIVSELPNATQGSRSEIYPFGGTGAGPVGCSISGGGEGIVVDPTKNVAYIATCCFRSEILVYDLAKGTYLAPIPVPGQDLLDVVLSTDRKYLYVTSYQGVSKVSTTTNTVVGIYSTNRLTNKDVGLWGVAVNPANGRVFVATNYFSGGGLSTIESVDSSYAGPSSLFTTAPSGYNYRGLNFGADGTLWAVASGTTGPDKLFHYNGTTGALIASFDFITPSITGTVGDVEAYDLAFGPDGNLYITTFYGDCVSKFNVTTNTFTTEIAYQPGEQGKSIAFVCGNLKCAGCDAPTVLASDISFTLGTCTGFVPNNNGTATISNLVYNASKVIEASIKEGETFGTTPIFGAGANQTLSVGQTSFTFTGLKPGTKYTVRIWSGSDACYNDVTFKTLDFSSKVTTSSGSVLCNPGIGTLNATCPVGLIPQWYNSATSTTVLGTGNTFIFNATSTISFFVGCKANDNHCGVATANRTQLTISVSSTPAAPLPATVAGGLICGAGSLDLKATCAPSYTPIWYDSQSSVVILGGGSPFTVPVTASKTYFVACKDLVSGCESPAGSRTPVVATFSPIPDPVISTSTSPVCAGTNVILSVTPATSTYVWTGPNGFTSSIQSPQLNNVQVSQGGIYSVEVSNGLCSNTTMINLVVFDRALGITATSTNSTCDQDLVKNDGTIKLTGFSTNLRYDISAGATYTGGKLYATSTAIPTDGVLRSDVPNPTTVVQQYTVRVFNANDCFSDHTVTIQKVTCDCGVARCIPYTISKTKTAVKKDLIRTVD